MHRNDPSDVTGSREIAWTAAASCAEIAPGQMVGVDLAGTEIAIYHLEDGTFCATDNICTHAFALLSDGWLTDDEIECPLHGGCFNVRSGKALCEPVTKDLTVYPVRIADGVVLVGIEQHESR